MTNSLITSVDQLKKEAFNENGDFIDFFILLGGGLARSSKRISYRPDSDEFLIIHEIDESYQEISATKLAHQTNLVEAISKNCLFKN